MNTFLREAGAVVAGFAAMLVAVAVTLAVLTGVSGLHPGVAPPTWFLGASVLLSGIGGVFGGAVCAWLAGRSHPRTTPVLAVIVGALGVWGALHPAPGQPVWYCWAVTTLGVVGVVSGSFFWTRARP